MKPCPTTISSAYEMTTMSVNGQTNDSLCTFCFYLLGDVCFYLCFCWLNKIVWPFDCQNAEYSSIHVNVAEFGDDWQPLSEADESSWLEWLDETLFLLHTGSLGFFLRTGLMCWMKITSDNCSKSLFLFLRKCFKKFIKQTTTLWSFRRLYLKCTLVAMKVASSHFKRLLFESHCVQFLVVRHVVFETLLDVRRQLMYVWKIRWSSLPDPSGFYGRLTPFLPLLKFSELLWSQRLPVDHGVLIINAHCIAVESHHSLCDGKKETNQRIARYQVALHSKHKHQIGAN